MIIHVERHSLRCVITFQENLGMGQLGWDHKWWKQNLEMGELQKQLYQVKSLLLHSPLSTEWSRTLKKLLLQVLEMLTDKPMDEPHLGLRLFSHLLEKLTVECYLETQHSCLYYTVGEMWLSVLKWYDTNLVCQYPVAMAKSVVVLNLQSEESCMFQGWLDRVLSIF